MPNDVETTVVVDSLQTTSTDSDKTYDNSFDSEKNPMWYIMTDKEEGPYPENAIIQSITAG